MAHRNDFETKKRVEDGFAYFFSEWSPRYPVNRYLITRSVPARSGLFKLYYKNNAGKILLFYMERVWYGGLRSEIRRASDPLEVSDRPRRHILSTHKCFYSYTIVESKLDMVDLLFAYSRKYLPGLEPPASSGRYEKVFVTD